MAKAVVGAGKVKVAAVTVMAVRSAMVGGVSVMQAAECWAPAT